MLSGGVIFLIPGSIVNPCSNLENCSSVRFFKSSFFLGHLNVPACRRLYNRRKPSPSQTSALMRSLRLPQRRKMVFGENGVNPDFSFTVAASPSMPQRRSVYPQAMYISLNFDSLSMSENLQYHFHMTGRRIRSNVDQSILKFYVDA